MRGLLVGLAFAFAIACGGSAKKAEMPPPPPGGDMRAEIDRLDGEITAEMQRMNEPRPDPQPDACVENCDPQRLAVAPAVEDPACKPASSQTCTESCTLKTSICQNAAKICEIAGKLGGTDAYANDKCNRGTASCDAAKKRCCNCT